MKTSAQKWGNSVAVRVPKSIVEKAGVHPRDSFDIEVVRGNIVLKPRLRRDFRLESLVKGITKRNVHEAVEFGPPVGRELL
jgi:antitoxin MazE